MLPLRRPDPSETVSCRARTDQSQHLAEDAAARHPPDVYDKIRLLLRSPLPCHRSWSGSGCAYQTGETAEGFLCRVGMNRRRQTRMDRVEKSSSVLVTIPRTSALAQN